jgi:iron complex outermembrane receptor protein
VQFFAPAAGNGAHGADVGMIPGIAVKSVEVLRDGASSQYGSDAIAGVINFVMKDASEGGSVQVTYGEFFEGEQSTKVAANAGFALGDSGFANLSFEWVDNDGLSRGIQRTSNYDQMIADGVDPSVIGADAPFGDAPFLQSWGRPQTEGIRFFLNSGFDISDSSEIYARFSAAETDGRYRFFYRTPDHSTLTEHRINGFTGLPAGYTPFLDGNQQDASMVFGVRGEFDSGMLYDVSYGYGKDELNYFLNNSVNPILPLTAALEIPQMGFDMGGYIQEENNFNLDFSLPVSDSVNLAFGAEAREEKFTVIAGEPAATEGAGPSGMTASRPAEAGDFTRDNVAIYADIEHDVSDALLMQYAVRYENFSDFGPTTNGKIAIRYRINDAFALRGAVSTGFHAPTPGQANVRSTITTFDGVTGAEQEEQLVSPTSDEALENGGAPLSEEKSVNYSVGFASDIGDNWSLTADYYRIEVSDRIYRVGDIPIVDPVITSISFYTNALDVAHQGIDLVLNGNIADHTDVTFAYAFNQIEVEGQKQINGANPVSDGTVEDIENNYPEHRFTLSSNSHFSDRWNLMGRITYYGEHYDERGTIGAAVEPSAKISSTFYLDLELGFQATDSLRIALGGVNVMDEFVGEIGPPNANRIGVGLQYPRRSAANYEGGSWYLKGIYSF